MTAGLAYASLFLRRNEELFCHAPLKVSSISYTVLPGRIRGYLFPTCSGCSPCPDRPILLVSRCLERSVHYLPRVARA